MPQRQSQNSSNECKIDIKKGQDGSMKMKIRGDCKKEHIEMARASLGGGNIPIDLSDD